MMGKRKGKGNGRLIIRLLLSARMAKLNLILSLVILALAVAMEIFYGVLGSGNQVICVFYISFPGVILAQVWNQLLMSNFVMSSPLCRRLQITLPVIGAGGFFFLAWALVALLRGILLLAGKTDVRDASWGILVAAVLMVIQMLYLGTCYKYFIVSTAGYVICMIPFLIFSVRLYSVGYSVGASVFPEGLLNHYPLAVLAGAGIVAAGIGLYALLLRVLRRKAIDKLAMGAIMRQA